MRFRCFTARANGVARSLQSEVGIGLPIDDTSSTDPSDARSRARVYAGIWDTGATGSVVSQRVIDECGLAPIGVVRVRHADGETQSPVYRTSMFLPNAVCIPVVRVVRGQPGGCDVLVGMDVIGSGDFAVSMDNGKTLFSFRCPSAGPIDFVASQAAALPGVEGPKPGRNDPCPCGSGLKYKRCHGRRT